MTENQRLKILIKQLGFDTQKEFAEKINIQQGSLSDILREKPGVGVSNYVLDKLESLFFINREWLKTGEGEMFNSDIQFDIKPKRRQTIQTKLEAKPLRLADPYGFDATNEKIYALPDNSLIMQVPVIPYKAWGSYMRGHHDPEFYDGLETMPVPVNSAHKGAYLIFEIGGESMLNPGSRQCIWPGEKLIGRDVKREHWKYKLHINSNECWIIVHKDGIVVKEIVAHDVDTGEITLHSWNPDKEEYPDYTILLQDVEQIFNVVDPFNKFG